MFKWRKHDKHEPKTPKLSSISLPDDRYTPLLFPTSYSERPPSNLLLQRVSTDMRTPSRFDSRQGHRDTQSGHSRSRTISTPARGVQAPRPIRPHPSQGPFNPVLENSHRIRIEPFRGPVSVPSAQYLEEQIRNNPVDPALLPQSTVHRMLYGPEYEYPEERKVKEVARKSGSRVERQLSKAYLEDLEDKKREAERLKAPSAPPMKKGKLLGLFSSATSTNRGGAAAPSKGGLLGRDKKDPVEFDDWKPVPVTTTPPLPTTILEPDQKALKSALKKTPSTRAPSAAVAAEAPAIKSALKNGRGPEPNGYYSENESSRRRKDSETVRRKTLGDYLKPIRVVETPSKAWLEQQQERIESAREKDLQRGGSYGHSIPQSRTRSVYGERPSTATLDLVANDKLEGAAAFAPTNSSTTPSPTEAHEYHRSRRASSGYQEPQHVHGKYMPAYIKEEFERTHHQIMTWETDPPIHANLTWPLIDYATRKRAPEPLIYFDAGFNPRNSKYPVKAKRGLHWSPLTRDEETMFVSLGAFISNMVIINKRLESWPIHIRMSHNIRIIDVFRAIYDVYAQPLTERELRDCGPEYIQRCERAFLQRCQDGPDFAHNEQRKGMLRIDLLRGRRVFKGLTPIPGQPHTFELLFDDI